MFRRLWSGLPRDVCFPANLTDLGYFVNEEDEVRSMANPNNYFKYYINRNERINMCQRFALDRAVEAIVHSRLGDEGLEKLRVPLGKPANKPHTPIFASPDLETRSRVVVVLGECTKDLGLLAGRVATGPGGIDEGSMVSLVRGLARQASSADDDAPPGIVLANTGQLHWWPQGGRAITLASSIAVPLPSLVHAGRKFYPEVNGIPGNADPAMHVGYVFNEVLYMLAGRHARIDVVAVGDACEIVQRFLDDAQNWAIWGSQLNAMVLLEPVMATELLSNDAFKQFLAKRTRAYLASPEPVDTPLAPIAGNPYMAIPPLGCPCFSSSETRFVECILVRCREQVLDYLSLLARNPDYENAPVAIAPPAPYEAMSMDEFWDSLPDSDKPRMDLVEPEVMREHARWVNQGGEPDFGACLWEEPDMLLGAAGQAYSWSGSQAMTGRLSSWDEEEEELETPTEEQSIQGDGCGDGKPGAEANPLDEYEEEVTTGGRRDPVLMTSEGAAEFIQ